MRSDSIHAAQRPATTTKRYPRSVVSIKDSVSKGLFYLPNVFPKVPWLVPLTFEKAERGLFQLRHLVLFFECMQIFLFAGLLFGWPAILSILKSEG